MASSLPAALRESVHSEAHAGDGTPSSRWQHPPSFYCPISQQCMHDPVVLADGHTYERRYIERWLEHHSTSPVSGVLLPQKDMFPNHALRNAIEEYFQQVFSVHRRAIRQSMVSPDLQSGLNSNMPLLRTIDALMQCSLLMNADLSIERVLRRIMDEAKTLVGAEVASVFLLDAKKQELYSTVNSTGVTIRIPISKGIAGHVASTGEAEVINDVYADARFNKSVDIKTGFRTRNMMCVPLKVKKGEVIGVVQLINKCGPAAFSGEQKDADRFGASSDDFAMDDLHFLQVFASQAATAIANSGSDLEQAAEKADKAHAATPATVIVPECGPKAKAPCESRTPSKSSGEAYCPVNDGNAERAKELPPRAPEPAPAPPPPTTSRRTLEPSAAEAAVMRPQRRLRSRQLAEAETSAACPTNSQSSGSSVPMASTPALPRPSAPRSPQDHAEEMPCVSANSIDSGHLGEAEVDVATEEARAKRKSGRTRQRVAKWWAKVRARTPSPEAGVFGTYANFA